MDKNEMETLEKRVNKYKLLDEKLKNVKEALELKDYVKSRYNGQEKTRINLTITYGNGSNHIDFGAIEDDLLYERIIEGLTNEKEKIEKEIKEL